MRRVCLFAGYNYNNVISQYVVDYLKELSGYCDVYYLADGVLDANQLSRISQYVKGAWVINHQGYDFYSWKLLVEKYVGWNGIEGYDELVLANDSCFCVNSFKPVFDKMDKRNLDIWGLLSADNSNVTEVSTFEEYLKKQNPEFHIGSYFLVIRKSFFAEQCFKDFIKAIEIEKNRALVCSKYEFGIFKLAVSKNAKLGCWNEFVWRYSTTYMRDSFNLIKNGFPLLKVRIFIDNIGGHSYMDELGEIAANFCTKDYSQYVEDVRKERGWVKPKTKTKPKWKQILQVYVPPVLLKLFKARNYRKWSKNIIHEITPPFINSVWYNLRHIKSINNTNNTRFTLARRPPYLGWLPEQIKDYNKNQQEIIASVKDAENIVIFFNVMRECISGGMLSIERFVQYSQNMAKEQGFTVITSNIPLGNACIKNPFFEYSSAPVDFRLLCEHIHPKKMILNIPECFVPEFINDLSKEEYCFLFSIPDLRINILNQNDELMPHQHYIEELRTLCNNKLTITAAHKRYATEEKSRQYKCPVFPLKPFLPEFYETPFDKKEKIIVLSPDNHEYKREILDKIKKELPDYELVTVKNMTLEQYKSLISKARFTITFGEGWDGYFLEPYLSSSIAFVVYNNTFFPKDFDYSLSTVYSTWDEMLNNLISDIRRCEDSKVYAQVVSQVRTEIDRFVNNDESMENLEAYYRRLKN